MSDFVTRANALNIDIGNVNRASDESRTRLKVRREQFTQLLHDFGAEEGIDLVTTYNEGGLDGIQAVLKKLHEAASAKLQQEVEVSQQIITAYGNKDFAAIDRLLGNVTVPVEAPVVKKLVSQVAAPVVQVETPVEEVEVFTAPVVKEESFVARAESSFAAMFEQKTETATVSVLDAVSAIDENSAPVPTMSFTDDEEEDALPEFVQTTKPSLAGFGFGDTEQKTAVKKETKVMSFTDDDSLPEKSAVIPSTGKTNLFLDEGEDTKADFGDIGLQDILGASAGLVQNVNNGNPGF